ncbi:large ribosomal subunit protein eL22-like [Eleutherodactylus coqui]|uniref:large ribosomal subunit protein eL22-like n=1 Tax=Eleutherodactylus coqui TaxID=57060 RepID=UPI0034636A89
MRYSRGPQDGWSSISLLLLAQVLPYRSFLGAYKPQPQKWTEHQTPPRSQLAANRTQTHQLEEAKEAAKARPVVSKAREVDKAVDINRDKAAAAASNPADNKDRIRAPPSRAVDSNKARVRAVANRVVDTNKDRVRAVASKAVEASRVMVKAVASKVKVAAVASKASLGDSRAKAEAVVKPRLRDNRAKVAAVAKARLGDNRAKVVGKVLEASKEDRVRIKDKGRDRILLLPPPPPLPTTLVKENNRSVINNPTVQYLFVSDDTCCLFIF